ncbi:hypothetical protein, conserved [Eimeria acervulina]|uniref:Uncharacterized protein n=1 Tax=Eimeria acervulina TaxID=5801 RepID=U6GKW8_EIMAC|nr:hypothetical protein, conserved [Eimeria acervulina]CDI79928.1 hypothetical protein, conserved [Eimeria acervulina]
MATRSFKLAVAASVFFLPTTFWDNAVAQEGAEDTSQWTSHGDQLQIEASTRGRLSGVSAAPHTVGRLPSLGAVQAFGTLVVAAAAVFLVLRWSSIRKQKPISQTHASGPAVPQGNTEPVELSANGLSAADVEHGGASGETDEIDLVELQISLLTLSPYDASTLSTAERRMVALAVEAFQGVGDELEVLYARAAELDRQRSNMQDRIEQVKERQKAGEHYSDTILETLQAAAEKLDDQADTAWEAYAAKDQQRDQMGYTAAQEQRSARLLSDSAARHSNDGTPPLTPKAAAAVAAAERVLQAVHRHSPLRVTARPSFSAERAARAEEAVKAHTRALIQAMQRWNQDRSGLVAAAQEALREAIVVLGQLEAGSWGETSKGLRTAVERLQTIINTATRSTANSWSMGSMILSDAEKAAATARAAAQVQRQTMDALRISRDLGKMLRNMDGTEGQYRKMETLFGDGVTIYTVALHTEVPREVPHEIYQPFVLAVKMCGNILGDATHSLKRYWHATIEKHRGLLVRATDALRATRMQATANGNAGISQLLESDMRNCRVALSQATTCYKRMMSYSTFPSAFPFLANGCIGLRIAMDSAQTQLVQAADALASAWETDLSEAVEAFKSHASLDNAREVSSRAEEGSDALARIYRLADPSPQFEGLESSIERARQLVEKFKQQQPQQQKSDQEQQEGTRTSGVASRLRHWLGGKVSGRE